MIFWCGEAGDTKMRGKQGTDKGRTGHKHGATTGDKKATTGQNEANKSKSRGNKTMPDNVKQRKKRRVWPENAPNSGKRDQTQNQGRNVRDHDKTAKPENGEKVGN